MSSQNSNPSPYSPSMGPGARPMQQGQADPGSILKEVNEIRSHYSFSVDDSAMVLGYDLNGAARHYKIPFDQIPLRSPSRWLLFGGPKRQLVSGTFAIDTIRGAENMAGRILNQKEVEGFTLHASKRILYTMSGTFVAFSGGWAVAWATRKNMKFPFMKPKPLERYDNFPNRYVPILKGNYARIMWHITRANVYAAIGLLLMNPLFAAMGDTSMMVGLYRDERTQTVVKSMKGSLNRINSNRARSGQENRPIQQQPQEQDQDLTEDQDSKQYYRDMESRMSDKYTRDTNFDEVPGKSSEATDMDQIQSQPSRMSSGRSWARNQPSGSAQRTTDTQQDQRESGSDFFFDDGSPVAQDDQSSRSRPNYQQSGGSVWARIRQGVSTQGSPSRGGSDSQQQRLPPRSPSRNDQGNVGDSYSFSSGDEEKQLARAQAQKEFDDMLERERRESGSNDYTRAMNAVESGNDMPVGNSWERRRRG